MELSWQMMTGLRAKLGPEEMKKMVTQYGLPASSSGNLGNTSISTANLSQSLLDLENCGLETSMVSSSAAGGAPLSEKLEKDTTTTLPDADFDDSVSRITTDTLNNMEATSNNWKTLADLKQQAIKEICYSVALQEFD